MLGIFYLDYAPQIFPRSARKMVIGYSKDDMLSKIEELNIPKDHVCWLSECRTPGYFIQGNIDEVSEWIEKHMPAKFGEPLRP